MFVSRLSKLGSCAIKTIVKSPLRYSPSAKPPTPSILTRFFSTDNAPGEKEQKISVTFVDKDGEEKQIKVPVGMSMLEAAHENDIDLEGACEASLACSTCHVIVTDVGYYNKLEDPSDEENDMLDLAFGLTEVSRLACQIIAHPDIDGTRLPDYRSSGYRWDSTGYPGCH